MQVQRQRALSGVGRHAQQGLQHVFGQQVVLQQAQQHDSRVGGLAGVGEPGRLAPRGIAPQGAQRLALVAEPVVERAQRPHRQAVEQGRLMQGMGSPPVRPADSRPKRADVVAQHQLQAVAVGLQAVAGAVLVEPLAAAVQRDPQVMLCPAFVGFRPEQRSHPLARNRRTQHGQAGHQQPRCTGGQQMALPAHHQVRRGQQLKCGAGKGHRAGLYRSSDSRAGRSRARRAIRSTVDQP